MLNDHKLDEFKFISQEQFNQLRKAYKDSSALRKAGSDVLELFCEITQRIYDDAKLCDDDDAKRATLLIQYMRDFKHIDRPENRGLSFRKFLWKQVSEHNLIPRLNQQSAKSHEASRDRASNPDSDRGLTNSSAVFLAKKKDWRASG